MEPVRKIVSMKQEQIAINAARKTKENNRRRKNSLRLLQVLR